VWTTDRDDEWVRLSPDGRLIYVMYNTDILHVYSFETRAELYTYTFTGSGMSDALTIGPNGRWFFALNDGSTLVRYELGDNGKIRPVIRRTMAAPVYSVDISPDGAQVALGMADGTVVRLDSHGLFVRSTMRAPRESAVLVVKFIGHQGSLFAATEDRTLCVWRVEDASLIFEHRNFSSAVVKAVESKEDGSYLLLTTMDNVVHVLDVHASFISEEATITCHFKADYAVKNAFFFGTRVFFAHVGTLICAIDYASRRSAVLPLDVGVIEFGVSRNQDSIGGMDRDGELVLWNYENIQHKTTDALF
jgi:WD40 repeat protein